MLKVGDPAPAFSLLDQRGETVNLSDFAGPKLLVYFHPAADTPGCTTQSCAVRDAREDAYDVWGEKMNYGKTYMGIIRSSFLIDEDDRIEQAWYKVSPKDTVPNAQKALAG